MRVRDWQEVLDEVVARNVDPDGWRAVAGTRQEGIGEDMFLGHPDVGVYQLKTYAKNPAELRGVGSRVARKVDDDLDPFFPGEDHRGRFAVRQPPDDEDAAETMATRLRETVRVHAEAPTGPEDFFEDVADALDSPAFGPMAYEFDGRPDELDELAGTFEEAEELLDAELDEVIEDDEVGRGFA